MLYHSYLYLYCYAVCSNGTLHERMIKEFPLYQTAPIMKKKVTACADSLMAIVDIKTFEGLASAAQRRTSERVAKRRIFYCEDDNDDGDEECISVLIVDDDNKLNAHTDDLLPNSQPDSQYTELNLPEVVRLNWIQHNLIQGIVTPAYPYDPKLFDLKHIALYKIMTGNQVFEEMYNQLKLQYTAVYNTLMTERKIQDEQKIVRDELTGKLYFIYICILLFLS